MPTLAAMAYKTSIGQPIIYPRNDLTYAENFLHMMFAGGWVGWGQPSLRACSLPHTAHSLDPLLYCTSCPWLWVRGLCCCSVLCKAATLLFS